MLNDFLQFHENIVSSNDVSTSEYQCSRISAARENLTKYEVKWEEVFSAYDCIQTFSLPVPLNQVNQYEEVDLENLIDIGALD